MHFYRRLLIAIVVLFWSLKVGGDDAVCPFWASVQKPRKASGLTEWDLCVVSSPYENHSRKTKSFLEWLFPCISGDGT